MLRNILIFSPKIRFDMLINVILIKNALIKIQIFDLKHRFIFFSVVASINFIFINIIANI